jgi:hypothetical protein
MKSRRIKIKYDDKEEYYDTLLDVANILGYDASHIYNVLNGRKKEPFLIFNKKLVFLEYIKNENFIDMNNKSEDEIKKEIKKEYNKRAYNKRKNKLQNDL